MRHLRIALYDMTSGTADEVIDLAGREMIPLFEAQPGFVRYEVGTLDSGGIVSFSIWETEAEAVRGGGSRRRLGREERRQPREASRGAHRQHRLGRGAVARRLRRSRDTYPPIGARSRAPGHYALVGSAL